MLAIRQSIRQLCLRSIICEMLGDGMMHAIISMLGGGSLEGPATEDERASLSTLLQSESAASINGARFREILAVHCARLAALLRQLEVALPPELVTAIVERAASAESADLTLCGGGGGGDPPCHGLRRHHHAIQWGAGGGSTALVTCARCARVVTASYIPRVLPETGGGWYALRKATVTAGEASFKQCRHFMLEQAGNVGERSTPDPSCAVRHRYSGLHSFRTVVASEWVLRGRVSYEVELARLCSLSAPPAVAVGCVTPTCNVNSDTAWAPGSRCWEGAWGFCVEGTGASTFHEIRALSQSQRASRGGRTSGGEWGVWEEPDLEVRSGDVLVVTIDATRRALGLQITRHGAAVGTARLLPLNTEPVEGEEEPLALAVGLKYANDSIRLTRKEATGRAERDWEPGAAG